MERPELTAQEMEALRAYASRNGRTWKHKLLDAWMTGADGREPESSRLRTIRNTIGPSGLLRIKL